MEKFISFGLFLFVTGMVGVFLTRRNIIICLMCIELMLLGSVMLFISFSLFFSDIRGMVFVIFILTVAAAETAVGLALLVSFYKKNKLIAIKDIKLLKG
jgi:NADH-quinone oxidoreductase subunit K